MKTYPDDIWEVAESLLRSGFGVFAGAGLSYGAGVPLANTLQRLVLCRLGFSETAIENFLKVDLPFEAVFEVLLSVSDCSLLLPVFAGLQPTRNHMLLAKLSGSNHLDTIVTTNFDSLIEEAFNREALTIQAFVSEEELGNVDWAASSHRLIKLHGTIGDLSGLALTIRKVAARYLAASRGKVIREFLSQNRLGPCLVFGYRASDHFDISPAIRNINGPRRSVIYIQHDPSAVTPRHLRIADYDPDHVFVATNAEILVCDANDLVSALWESAFGEPAPQVTLADESWVSHVDRWIDDICRQNGEGFTLYLAGLLQKAANNWHDSNLLLQCAIDRGLEEALLAGVELARGNNYRDLCDAAQARAALNLARDLAQTGGQSEKVASALNSLGMVDEDEHLHDAAIANYEAALEIASKVGYRELEGKCHGNIGIAQKNKGGDEHLAWAIYHHHRGLAIARGIGDKRSEGRCLGNLGITHSDIGDLDVAKIYYEKALGIASELGDRLHVAIWLHNIGEDSIAVDKARAAALLRKATALFRVLDQESSALQSESALRKIDEGGDSDYT